MTTAPWRANRRATTVARYPNRDYPGAETLESVVARGIAGLTEIAAEYADRDTIIVCHGTIIRYTLASLAGRRLPGILNGSISTIELDPGCLGRPQRQRDCRSSLVPIPPDERPREGDTVDALGTGVSRS